MHAITNQVYTGVKVRFRFTDLTGVAESGGRIEGFYITASQ